ncbi:MAG TPA: OmpH family outer membrane protein [Flavilitoribacter sp.]|nr:OmpH family outer membrane protein [Flavilitoribacter sp.]HMQ87332.1 OmpH family outer membrane protein [Flavilitoribacter sp.]
MGKMLKVGAMLLFFSVIAFNAQAQKFGYVNSADILASLPEVKQADASLDALQKQLQKKGQGMVDQLQQDYLAVQQKVERGDLSPKQQEEEAGKLKNREAEISKFEQDMMKQLQDKRNELLEPIYKKVNDAIAAVAKENGYQFIFEKSVLLYFEETQDVSSMVKSKLGI